MDDSKIKRIVIAGGGYGLSNKGDDAILFGMLEIFDKLLDKNQVKIKIILKNPSVIKGGLYETGKPSIRNIWNELSDQDFLILGGGNVFQKVEKWYRSYPGYQIILMLIMLIKKKKTMVFAVGAENISSRMIIFLLRFFLNKVDIISVRDSKTKDILLKWKINNEIREVLDPAFFMQIRSQDYSIKLLREQGININKGFIALNVLEERNNKNDEWKPAFAQFCNHLLENNMPVLFVPSETRENQDLKAIKDVIALMDTKNLDNVYILKTDDLNPSEISGILSLAHKVISMRLHVSIMAMNTGVPVIPIIWPSNESKIFGLIEKFGLSSADIRDLEVNKLIDLFDNTTSNYKNIMEKMKIDTLDIINDALILGGLK